MSEVPTAREPFRVDAFVMLVSLGIASLLVFMASFGQLGIVPQTNESINFTTVDLTRATGYDYLALISGLLSMIACVVMSILLRFVDFIKGRILQIFSFVIAIYWIICHIILTFVSPFTSLSNGFLSIWMCTFLAVLLMFETSNTAKSVYEKLEALVIESSLSAIVLNILFALVEMSTASALCNIACTEIIGYAVGVGVIGLIPPLLFFVPMIPPKVKAGLAIFNMVWWLIANLTLTFFTETFPPITYANGFFGTWGALIFSVTGSMPYIAALDIAAFNALTAKRQ